MTITHGRYSETGPEPNQPAIPVRLASLEEVFDLDFLGHEFEALYLPIANRIPHGITSVSARLHHGDWLMRLSARPEVHGLWNNGHRLTDREILDLDASAWHWREASPLKKTAQFLQHHYGTHPAQAAVFRREGIIAVYQNGAERFGLLLPLPGASGHDVIAAMDAIATDFPGFFRFPGQQ